MVFYIAGRRNTQLRLVGIQKYDLGLMMPKPTQSKLVQNLAECFAEKGRFFKLVDG